MDKIPTAPRVCKRQSDDLSSSRAPYGTANTTEERAAKEVIGDGKAAMLWREAAIKACQLHLRDLYEEALRAHAAKR